MTLLAVHFGAGRTSETRKCPDWCRMRCAGPLACHKMSFLTGISDWWNGLDGEPKTATVSRMNKKDTYTLEVDADTYALLKASKRKNETFSAAIRRGFRERLPFRVKRVTDTKVLAAMRKMDEEEEFIQAKSCRDLLT